MAFISKLSVPEKGISTGRYLTTPLLGVTSYTFSLARGTSADNSGNTVAFPNSLPPLVSVPLTFSWLGRPVSL